MSDYKGYYASRDILYTQMVRVSKEEYYQAPENFRIMEGDEIFETAHYYVHKRILQKIQINNSLSKTIEQKPQKIRRKM